MGVLLRMDANTSRMVQHAFHLTNQGADRGERRRTRSIASNGRLRHERDGTWTRHTVRMNHLLLRVATIPKGHLF